MPMLAPLMGRWMGACGRGWLTMLPNTAPETKLAMMTFNENARA